MYFKKPTFTLNYFMNPLWSCFQDTDAPDIMQISFEATDPETGSPDPSLIATVTVTSPSLDGPETFQVNSSNKITFRKIIRT